MPKLKDVPENGCPEDRAYCSDFDPSGKKCRYYNFCIVPDQSSEKGEGET